MKISVPMIAYKLAESELAAIKTIAKCDFPKEDYEIVLVYEHYDAEIHKTIKKLAKSHGLNIKTKKIPSGRGLGYNRNRSVELCSAEYLAMTDPHCSVPPNWLSLMYESLHNSPDDVTMVAGNVRIPKSTFFGDCISMLGYPGGANLGFDKMHKISPEGYTTHTTTANCGMKKSVLLKVWGFYEKDMHCGGEDKTLAFKLNRSGYKIKYIPELVVWHPARTGLREFIAWMFYKGRNADVFFEHRPKYKKEIMKTRLWSSCNIIRATGFSVKLPVVGFLLFTGFGLQMAGYLYEAMKRKQEKRQKTLI